MFLSIPARHCVRCFHLIALAGATLTAAAQPVRPDPSDPRAAVPPVAYTSPFSGYARVVDGKPVTWREANDTVARIGGWRVYAREAQAPEATAPAPAKAAIAAEAAEAAEENKANKAIKADNAPKHSGHRP